MHWPVRRLLAKVRTVYDMVLPGMVRFASSLQPDMLARTKILRGYVSGMLDCTDNIR